GGAPWGGWIWGGWFGGGGPGGARWGRCPYGGGACRSTRPGCEGVSLPPHSGQGISLAAITSPSHPTTSIFFPFLPLISAARFGGRYDCSGLSLSSASTYGIRGMCHRRRA